MARTIQNLFDVIRGKKKIVFVKKIKINNIILFQQSNILIHIKN